MTKSLTAVMLDLWVEQKQSMPADVCERIELLSAEATKKARELHKSDDVLMRRVAFALACCIGAQIIPILESPVE